MKRLLTLGKGRGPVAVIYLLFALVALPVFAKEASQQSPFLSGLLLVADPKMEDPRFSKTVIYMVRHDATGAFGLIVNKSYGAGPMEEFLKGFGIDGNEVSGDIRLHYGGPVSPGEGFVLHTADYKSPDTKTVNDIFALTSEKSVLEAIAKGNGPRRSIFVFGYSGWGAGQLEGEIARGDWLSAPADEKLVFDEALETKWDRATKKIRLKL